MKEWKFFSFFLTIQALKPWDIFRYTHYYNFFRNLSWKICCSKDEGKSERIGKEKLKKNLITEEKRETRGKQKGKKKDKQKGNKREREKGRRGVEKGIKRKWKETR